MTKSSPKLCLAIDGGTTNTRARLFRGDDFVSVAARPIGVRNVAIGDTTEPLRHAITECVAEAVRRAGVRIEDVELLCGSGMLTSNVGLRDVPHMLAPAGLDDLARHVLPLPFPEIAPQPIYLIPGVKTMTRAVNPPQPTPYGKQRRSHGVWDSLAEIDILRGEESETFGILAATGRHGPLCLLLPGSHTKLVRIDAVDRITGSFTTIAGEVMQALAEHTILAHSIDWPPKGEPEWATVLAGADFARHEGLLRAGFAVRLADVVLQLDRAARTWFFFGMIVGSDITELIGEFARVPQFSHGVPLVIGGRQPLRSAYGMLIRDLGFGSVVVLDDATVECASGRGAIAIVSATRR